MKKIMIIGAGYLQNFAIIKAKNLGYTVIAVDKDKNAIGFENADFYKNIDITDEEACLNYAKECAIDGVLTVATDFGVLTASYIAQEMNLKGLEYSVAKVIKNKHEVRKLLAEKNIDDMSQYFEINNIETLRKIQNEIVYPVMVKPCDGSGSKGASKVESYDELELAFLKAKKSSLSRKVLIETFIVGNEYGVESFVLDGEIYILGIMDKEMTPPPNYAELGHSYPSNLTKNEKNKVKEIVRKAIKALDINFGSINIDLLVSAHGEISIIDIGARMGGNLIGSHIIPLGTGIDYLGNSIKMTVGDSIDINSETTETFVTTRILALTSGEIIGLPNFDKIKNECKVNIYHHLKIGNIIDEYQNNLDGCGYIVATDNKKDGAIKRVEKAKKLVNKGIIRA